MKIKKLLIANRGEIAVRVIRAARDLGIRTVQVHSSVDKDSLAVKLADEAIDIGSPIASKSYLNGEVILKSAQEAGVDAIHPGYGFLSENADFVEEVEKIGIVFIGPSSQTIRLMGDKASARQSAIQAGVPVVPGSDGVVKDLKEAKSIAEQIGYPVMIKATAGGGGRGIRIVNDSKEFDSLFTQASVEAKAAFGYDGIYLEKMINNARHIEVQILGDGRNVIHLYERECSLQRRRQKIWEEAPFFLLTDETRKELCDTSVALAKSVDYKGAGTIEYLYDDSTNSFYFIEMNTRIQVEHPVTECITGVDLVSEMIGIAGGKQLFLQQNDVLIYGHAIEVRINAEDPDNNFLPSPGEIAELSVPGGMGVRFDHMMYPGYQVQPYYDSLLGKLIVWSRDRDTAIKNLSGSISELKISGIKTTIPLLQKLTQVKNVFSGQFHSQWLEPWLEKAIHSK